MSPSSESRPVPVPKGRIARLSRLSRMASGIAGGMAVEGARRVYRGERPEMRDLLLTPANISRLTSELARMRGAAMKVGQILSMDAGEMMPRELAEIMARLRAGADYMPPKQLRPVLDANWGTGWLSKFKGFDPRPVAAASIGQVHRAQTRDGRDLAIKVQYPGVRESIDSDIANVGGLVSLSGLVPPGIELAPLLEEAKRQLREEADYAREAAGLMRYRAALGESADFRVPGVAEEFTTRDVLAMEFLSGVPIEDVAALGQAERDRVTASLIGLLFREIFGFRLVQTDPNFANYRYDGETGRVLLLDFGALKEVAAPLAEAYRTLFAAGMRGDRDALWRAAVEIGFLTEETGERHADLVLRMMERAFVPLREDRAFDFADPDYAREIHEIGMELGMEKDFTHVPPFETLYLQRKFGGLYLLGARLGAQVNVHRLALPHIEGSAEP